MKNKKRLFGAAVIVSAYAVFKLIVHFRGEITGCLQIKAHMVCMDSGYEAFRYVMDMDLIFTVIACTAALALWWNYYLNHIKRIK
jgi:hypothetical protein